MTDARIAAENRWDGPIPPEVIDRLRYGSGTKAEIARTEDLIVGFRNLIMRTGPHARKWRARGDEKRVRDNIADSWLYLREWRGLRRRLKQLRGTNASVKSAGRFFDALNPKEPGDG